MIIDKATPRGDRARIEALIAREESRVRRAFRRFLDEVRSPEVRRQVRLALESGGVEAALRVVDAHVVRLGSVMAEVFAGAGRAEVDALSRQLRARGAVVASFDPAHPRAADIMRRSRLEFVREFTRSQREASGAALTDALRTGAGPIQTARAFRDSIGLTQRQREAVATYRRLLEAGDAAALSRDLRDRRFDPSVRRAVADAEPLGAQRIGRMVDRYRGRYLQYRAETIARTETQRAVNQARAEALEQLSEQVELPPDAVTRTWRSIPDDARVRDTHAAMNGQERDAATPFTTPGGARLMFPGDGSLGAPASEIVNCLLGSSLVEAPGLTAIARGWYDGEAVEIKLASGRKLAGTANHPVMTDVGWSPLTALDEGSQLVCHALSNWSVSTCGDAEYVPTTIENLYESAALVTVVRERLRMNFHGDVVDSEVEIKLPAGSLLSVLNVERFEYASQMLFGRPHVSYSLVACDRSPEFAFIGVFASAACLVCCSDLLGARFIRHVGPLDELSLRLGAWPYSKSVERAVDGGSAHAVQIAEIRRRQPGLVELDEVIRVRRFKFSGHVYSPQTISGMYLSDSILNHNCRCVLLTSISAA